jgi:hypothetical protein
VSAVDDDYSFSQGPSLGISRATTLKGNDPDSILQEQAAGLMGLAAKLRYICAAQDVRQSGPDLTPGKSTARTTREERLAEALRENLRRRKEQGRARQQEPPQPKARNRE